MEPQPDNAAANRSWQLKIVPGPSHVTYRWDLVIGDKNMELRTLSLAYIFVLIRVNSWLI